MKLDEYMRSAYWARVHNIIRSKLKDAGVIEVDAIEDKEIIIALYKELRQQHINISIHAYFVLLGLNEDTKISHEIMTC